MNSLKNYLLVFLALAVLGGAALAWKQQLELIKLRAALQDKDWDAQKQKRAYDTKLATLRANAGKKADANNDDAQPNSPNDQRQRGRFGNMRALMNDPQFAKLMALQQKARLDSTYAPLFKQLSQQLNLSPAQISAFQNLLAQKQEAARDVITAARDQGLDPRTDRAAINQLVTQSNAEIDSQIQTALGPTGFAQYQSYEQTLPERNTVNQIQTSLSYTSAPLTDQQTQQLIGLLADNSSQNTFNPTGNRALNGGGNPSSPITDAEINQAASFLSTEQIAALQQQQQLQQAQAEMARQMRAAEQQNRGPAPTGATATATTAR